MANRTQQAFGFGTNVLKANLNEDMEEAQFIKSGIYRWIFIKLSNASAAVLSFLLVYLTSTRQLENLDPITYFKESPRRTTFIIIGALTLICYAQSKFAESEDARAGDTNAKQSQQINQEGTPLPSLAMRKMVFELGADFLRVVNYFLIFYVLDQDVFETTTNCHLVITKYCLILMWILFTARKLVFWGNILFKQAKNGEIDLYPWQANYIANKNKVNEIQNDINSKFQQINLLLHQAHQKKD